MQNRNVQTICADHGRTKENPVNSSSYARDTTEGAIPETARIPIQPKLSAAVDAGLVELYEGPWLDKLTASLLKDVED